MSRQVIRSCNAVFLLDRSDGASPNALHQNGGGMGRGLHGKNIIDSESSSEHATWPPHPASPPNDTTSPGHTQSGGEGLDDGALFDASNHPLGRSLTSGRQALICDAESIRRVAPDVKSGSPLRFDICGAAAHRATPRTHTSSVRSASQELGPPGDRWFPVHARWPNVPWRAELPRGRTTGKSLIVGRSNPIGRFQPALACAACRHEAAFS